MKELEFEYFLKMSELNVEGKHFSRVADFYHGKSVFVTGVSGFFGSILLETLLRCCCDIKSIYILLRPKKSIKPEARIEKIFNKKIFRKIKEKDPGLWKKVQVIHGDVSYSDLKMSEEDIQLLIKEVSVVFHCASNTNLIQTLKESVLNNALGMQNVIELCKRLRKLEALVYTSTAYSNSNHTNILLKEEVYRLPFQANTFLETLQNKDDEKLHELVNQCKPEWANSYTFSKCLAENVLFDNASDLPIAIIRPSLIFSTWKQPITGYAEGGSLHEAFFFGIGKGLLKIVYADPKFLMDYVPADVVANAHVLVAYCIGTKRYACPKVFHCTATEEFRVPVSEYAKIAYQIALKFPFPQPFTKPTECIITTNRYLFYMGIFYYHYLPAIFLDGILRIIGKKSKIYSTYRTIESGLSSCRFLKFHSFEFERKNLECIDKMIHLQDRQELPLDFKNASFMEIALRIPTVSPLFDQSIHAIAPKERQTFKYGSHLAVKFIQSIFIVIFNLLLYWIFAIFFL